jgi:hypothetical protein
MEIEAERLAEDIQAYQYFIHTMYYTSVFWVAGGRRRRIADERIQVGEKRTVRYPHIIDFRSMVRGYINNGQPWVYDIKYKVAAPNVEQLVAEFAPVVAIFRLGADFPRVFNAGDPAHIEATERFISDCFNLRNLTIVRTLLNNHANYDVMFVPKSYMVKGRLAEKKELTQEQKWKAKVKREFNKLFGKLPARCGYALIASRLSPVTKKPLASIRVRDATSGSAVSGEDIRREYSTTLNVTYEGGFPRSAIFIDWSSMFDKLGQDETDAFMAVVMEDLADPDRQQQIMDWEASRARQIEAGQCELPIGSRRGGERRRTRRR